MVCTNSEGLQTLVGITSWGIGCGRVGYPGVVTRISSFIDFILNVTSEYDGKYINILTISGLQKQR